MKDRTSSSGTIILYILSLVFVGLAIAALWTSISSVSIILLSLSSLLLAGIDLSMTKIENEATFRELPSWIVKVFRGTERRRIPRYIALAILLLLASLLFAITRNPQPSAVAALSDFLLMFTLAVIVFTYGVRNHLRDKSPFGEVHNNSVPFEAAWTEVVKTEYKTVQNISRIMLMLQDYDRRVRGIGRVHDGWSLFHDSLEEFYITEVGPLYILNHLFWEFANDIGHAAEIFGTISNPDRFLLMGKVQMWNHEYEVHSFSMYPNDSGFDKGYQYLDNASQKWVELKQSIEKIYTRHT